MKKFIVVFLSVLILIFGIFIYSKQTRQMRVIERFFTVYYEQYGFRNEFLELLLLDNYDEVEGHASKFLEFTTPSFFEKMISINFWYPKDLFPSDFIRATVKKISLKEKSKEENDIKYDFEMIVIKTHENLMTEEQLRTGSINLVKIDGKWFVDYYEFDKLKIKPN